MRTSHSNMCNINFNTQQRTKIFNYDNDRKVFCKFGHNMSKTRPKKHTLATYTDNWLNDKRKFNFATTFQTNGIGTYLHNSMTYVKMFCFDNESVRHRYIHISKTIHVIRMLCIGKSSYLESGAKKRIGSKLFYYRHVLTAVL